MPDGTGGTAVLASPRHLFWRASMMALRFFHPPTSFTDSYSRENIGPNDFDESARFGGVETENG
jgi:hypothetical protein